jgi:broad specificity phosphatase PhoE
VLILARHGQTEHNREGRLLGRTDIPLTDLGRRQAEAMARAVGTVDRIVCSPLARARETAAFLGLPVEIDDRWIEVDYGEYEGLAFSDVPAEFWRQWRSDATLAPPGGESLAAVGDRVRAACADLEASAIDANVLVVSHVSPIKAGVAWALEVGDEISWHLFLDVAAICRIRVGPRGTAVTAFNDTSHLREVGD